MKSGIYRIVNLVNNKMYIGSSYRIDVRYSHHIGLLKINKHHSKHLQNAWNKYSESNFKLEVLEYCDESELLEKEQYYLNLYLEADKYFAGEKSIFLEQGYNVCPLSIKGFTGKHSRESILKQLKSRGLSEIYKVDIQGNILEIYDIKGEIPDNVGPIYLSIKTGNCLKDKDYGYITADKYFEGFKPKEVQIWNKGLNIEYKGETRKVSLYTIYGSFVKDFNSLKECADYLNSKSSNIIKKINQIPNKILIDSEPSKHLIFDELGEREQLPNVIDYWNRVFTIIVQLEKTKFNIFNTVQESKQRKLKVYDCFDNFIGWANEKDLAETLEVEISTIYSNIAKGRRIKSLLITRK